MNSFVELDIDHICDEIINGQSLSDIARGLGCSVAKVVKWIAADDQRSARARAARAESAKLWDEKATELIAAAPDVFELSKAKELAHHYRWRASKIAPREYGDKVEQIHANPDGTALGINVQLVQPTPSEEGK